MMRQQTSARAMLVSRPTRLSQKGERTWLSIHGLEPVLLTTFYFLLLFYAVIMLWWRLISFKIPFTTSCFVFYFVFLCFAFPAC